MLHPRVVAVGALVAVLSIAMIGPSVAQQQGFPEKAWIRISVEGEERVGLVPRTEPYLDGAPRVRFPIEGIDRVVAKDDRPVAILEAIAWREGGGARLMVFGLSERGADDSKRFLTSMLVEWDSSSAFTRLEEMGIRGVSVAAGAAPDG